MSLSSVLIANRGEIAVRIIRTCRELGIRTVLAHSTADRDSVAARFADETVQIGPAEARRSYLDLAAVLQAAEQTGVDAIHPGYGFLSEDADLAAACRAHGRTLVGPPPEVMTALADKAEARKRAADAGLPVLPGSVTADPDPAEAGRVAAEVGYPVLLKAAAGGGGRGMAVVRSPQEFGATYAKTRAAAQAVFGDPKLYVEKYLDFARHVEVQILADGYGDVVHLGARDCSVQRSRQKLIEEAPPVALPPAPAARMCELAVGAARAMGYVGAGTYEFVVDEHGNFFFIEVNCRIQVEHPVTEMLTGVDLIREQLLVAGGSRLAMKQSDIDPRGCAIECRINAEDASHGFLPTGGIVDEFVAPGGPFVRVDTHCRSGTTVSPYYDSLLAKLLVWAPDRPQALARMRRALAELVVASRDVRTTKDFLLAVLENPEFVHGEHGTTLVDKMLASSEPAFENALRED